MNIPETHTTLRLLLRPPMAGDGEAINEAVLESFEDITLHMPWAKVRSTVKESEVMAIEAHAKWVTKQELAYSIFDKSNDRYLGGILIHNINWDLRRFEFGFWLRSSYVGKRIMTEALRPLIDMCFYELDASFLEIRCSPRNEKAQRVARRLGFQKKSDVYYTRQFADEY